MIEETSAIDEREAVAEDKPIHVLLVDDNEQWARFIAEDIERQHPDLRITLAMSANEAMQKLRETGSIDCVVADYWMPEINGIQLLERVHDEQPDLPFLLVTGEGSEDVASRAIKAGATEYLIKDPRTDQTSLFANRIRTAVEQRRLQQSIEESEERYRTVTEQSHEAIVIGQDGDFVFANRRLVELTGYDESTLREIDVVEEVVHPDDHDRVRRTIDGWYDGTDEGRLHETRIITKDGSVRHCEYTGRKITYRGDPAVLVSIRDVSERKRRERELEWERELNRTVQRALIESRTREEFEDAICEQLCEYGYELAWIGGTTDGSVYPRVAHGDDAAYVDTIDLSTEGGNDNEPSVWAARSGESQFLSDFEDLFPTDWREAAYAAGFRSGAALPLAYNDVRYGVLAVYDDRPDRFDETERRLLTELADTVAFAIHSIGTEHALASDHAVEVELSLDGTDYYLNELARSDDIRTSNGRITVRGTVPDDDDRVIQYVTVEGVAAGTFRERALEHRAATEVNTITENGGESRHQIVVTEPTPESRLATLGTVVRSTTVTAGGADLRIELPAKQDVRETVERLEETFPSVSVRSVVQTDRRRSAANGRPPDEIGDLTEKQANALHAAYHHGYFEHPRKSSAKEIAESLGVSHSTFLQHLRVAQQKLFDNLYD